MAENFAYLKLVPESSESSHHQKGFETSNPSLEGSAAKDLSGVQDDADKTLAVQAAENFKGDNSSATESSIFSSVNKWDAENLIKSNADQIQGNVTRDQMETSTTNVSATVNKNILSEGEIDDRDLKSGDDLEKFFKDGSDQHTACDSNKNQETDKKNREISLDNSGFQNIGNEISLDNSGFQITGKPISQNHSGFQNAENDKHLGKLDAVKKSRDSQAEAQNPGDEKGPFRIHATEEGRHGKGFSGPEQRSRDGTERIMSTAERISDSDQSGVEKRLEVDRVDIGAEPATPDVDRGAQPATPHVDRGAKPATPDVDRGAKPATPDVDRADVDELRQVFDAVAEEGSGTVKISRLLQLAGEHLGHSHQSISELLQSMPDDVISFEQFCDTVSAILRPDEGLSEAERPVANTPPEASLPAPPSSPHLFPEAEVFSNFSDDREDLPVTQPRRRKQPIRSRTFVRTKSLPAQSFGRSSTPPFSYYPNQHNSPPSLPRSSPLYHSPHSSSPPAGHTLLEEEDLHSRMRGEETGSPSSLSEVDSALGGSTTSPGSCRKANSGTWSVNGEREEAHYESYGAADDGPDISRVVYAGCAERGPDSPPQPTSLPPPTLAHRNSWTRRSLRVAPSTVTFTLGEEDLENLEQEPLMELDEDRLHDADYLHMKVKQLQNKVEVLGDNQSDSQDRIVRVKQENSVLQERVVMLEEQLREVEHRAEERLAEEQRRNRELIQRVEREKSLTVENCTIKQEHLEKTTQRLEEELQRLRSKADRHQRERNELENRLSEAQILAANLKEENKVLASQSKKELLQDQEQSAKVIEELRAEVERLTAVLESNGRKRVPSTDSITASTDQLTAALTALRQENKSLEEQVEELQAQLLTRGLEEGRELITAAANQSLAAEFDAMTQEELQKSLHDVQEANKQLRTYIDGILLTIVENHPQLLEVKRKSS